MHYPRVPHTWLGVVLSGSVIPIIPGSPLTPFSESESEYAFQVAPELSVILLPPC